jgi:hypothetical protein
VGRFARQVALPEPIVDLPQPLDEASLRAVGLDLPGSHSGLVQRSDVGH